MLVRLYILLVCTLYPLLQSATVDADAWETESVKFRHVTTVSVLAQTVFDVLFLSWIPLAELGLAVALTVVARYPDLATLVFDRTVVPLAHQYVPQWKALEKMLMQRGTVVVEKATTKSKSYWRRFVFEGGITRLLGGSENTDEKAD